MTILIGYQLYDKIILIKIIIQNYKSSKSSSKDIHLNSLITSKSIYLSIIFLFSSVPKLLKLSISIIKESGFNGARFDQLIRIVSNSSGSNSGCTTSTQ